jgi:hypothetical protein
LTHPGSRVHGWVVAGAVAAVISPVVVDMVQNRKSPRGMVWDQPKAIGGELDLVVISLHRSVHLSSAIQEEPVVVLALTNLRFVGRWADEG